MKKRICAIALVMGICVSGGQTLNTDCNSSAFFTKAEARASLAAADREMKKEKNYEPSDIYKRAHHIIYPNGRVPKDQRTRIAVVINGDEQIVVEDRVKNRIYSKLRAKFSPEEFALMKGTDVKTSLLQMEEDKFYDNRPSSSISTNRQPYRSASGFSIASVAGTVAGAVIAHNRGQSEINGALIGAAADTLISGNGSNNENSTTTSITSRTDVDQMPVGIQPRGFADLRREDFVEVGRKYGYDYLFVVTMNVGMLKHEKHGFVLFNSTTNKGNIWVRVRLVDVNKGDYAYRNDIVTAGSTHGSNFSGSGVNGRLMEKAVDKAMTEAMNDIAIEIE